MAYGSFLSALLHICVLALTVLGLPSVLDRAPPEAAAVTVEMATLSELEALAGPAPGPPRPPEPRRPPRTAEPPPEPPPLPAPAPEPEAAAPPAPEARPRPGVEAPRAKPTPPPGRPERAAAKRPPKPRRRPPRPDTIETVLKNLDRVARPEPPKPDGKGAPGRRTLSERVRAEARRRGREAAVDREVRRQLEPCWSIPAGAKDAAGVRVAVHIRLRPDGSLAAPPRVEDAGRPGGDPVFRAVMESAVRALRDRRCVPFKGLAYDDYPIWRDIVFVFDPKRMLGE